MNDTIEITSLLTLSLFIIVSVQIIFDYFSTKYLEFEIEVVIDDELEHFSGVGNFVEQLLEEMSEARIEKFHKGDRRAIAFDKKHNHFGKIIKVRLDYWKRSDKEEFFTVRVFAKKLGDFASQQTIYLEEFHEMEFKIDSFQKSLFQPSFFVEYSTDIISVKELKKFINYVMAV